MYYVLKIILKFKAPVRFYDNSLKTNVSVYSKSLNIKIINKNMKTNTKQVKRKLKKKKNLKSLKSNA